MDLIAKIAVPALLLTASGCFSEDFTIDVGYHGSPQGYVEALVAADTWNQRCQAPLFYVHWGDGALQMYEQMHVDGAPEDRAGETTWHRPGLCYAYGPTRATDVWFLKGEQPLPIIVHEFGHVVGLHHTPFGIMRPLSGFDELDITHSELKPEMIFDWQCAHAKDVIHRF